MSRKTGLILKLDFLLRVQIQQLGKAVQRNLLIRLSDDQALLLILKFDVCSQASTPVATPFFCISEV